MSQAGKGRRQEARTLFVQPRKEGHHGWTSFSHFHLAELLPGKQKSGPVNRRAGLHELEQLGTASNTISRHRK